MTMSADNNLRRSENEAPLPGLEDIRPPRGPENARQTTHGSSPSASLGPSTGVLQTLPSHSAHDEPSATPQPSIACPPNLRREAG